MREGLSDPAKEAFKQKQREERLAEETKRFATNPDGLAYIEKKKKGELGKEPPAIH